MHNLSNRADQRRRGLEVDRPGERTKVLPNVGDYHIVFSTLRGKQSYRYTCEGTVFVRNFCHNLDKYGAREDYCTILEKVRGDMMNWMEVSEPTGNKQMQIPEDTSTLVKKVYFDVTKKY